MSKNTSILYNPHFMNSEEPNFLSDRPVDNLDLLKSRYNLGLIIFLAGWIGGYQFLSRNKIENRTLAYIRSSNALKIAAPFMFFIHAGRIIGGYDFKSRDYYLA